MFMGLSSRDNLRVGRVDLDAALELFPELGATHRGPGWAALRRRAADAHAGPSPGRKPKVLLADELSMGLAPR